ncbi:MAG: hypothetical protein QOF79_3 [Actinomycetota bacterium]|nr:hypothetical protein [Actinomycetota bacterium]
MSTFRTPVGPQPSKVYWRRRLLVILGIVAVVIIVVLILVRPGSGKPAAHNTPNPSTSASSPAVIKDCKKSDVTVEAQTDAISYAAGVDPKLSLIITNTGSVACNMKVGTDVQVYTITSGSETIWSSKDCQQNPAAAVKQLEPGTPVQSTPFAWDRTRSDPSTCKSTTRPQVIAKGASYHLNVSVDGDASAKSKQFVLK